MITRNPHKSQLAYDQSIDVIANRYKDELSKIVDKPSSKLWEHLIDDFYELFRSKGFDSFETHCACQGVIDDLMAA